MDELFVMEIVICIDPNLAILNYSIKLHNGKVGVPHKEYFFLKMLNHISNSMEH